MSIRFCLLASGSKGNAIYIQNGKRALLVDCGISGVELMRRLEAAGLAPESIEAVVLTHEHRDHSSGAGIMGRKLRVPVLATDATFTAAPGLGKVRRRAIKAGSAFEAAGLSITPFSTPHDAADPVGLVFSQGACRLGLCTDLGWATRLVCARLAGCQGLILESNHDPRQLADGPYPEWLKQRVRSRHGHLSNAQGAELLRSLHHPDLEQVVLAHLSETNNTPDLAERESRATLDDLNSDANLQLAAQAKPTCVMEI